MRNGNTTGDQEKKDSGLGYVHDISFDEYFSGVKMEELIQKVDEK